MNILIVGETPTEVKPVEIPEDIDLFELDLCLISAGTMAASFLEITTLPYFARNPAIAEKRKMAVDLINVVKAKMEVRKQEVELEAKVATVPGRILVWLRQGPAMIINAATQFTELPTRLSDFLNADAAQKEEGDESSLRSEGSPADVLPETGEAKCRATRLTAQTS